MTFGEIKRATLQLMNQYSVAGGSISPTYNNQQDYINRIPFLVNDAMVYIATHAKGINRAVNLSELTSENLGKMTKYSMPTDFFSFVTNYAQRWGDKGIDYWSFTAVRDGGIFMLPSLAPPDAFVEYNRLPTLLPEEPADYMELDNSVDAQMLIPYYVASHLFVDENAYAQAILYNEFETRLSRLANPKSYAVVDRNDVYDFGGTVYEA